MKSSGAPEVGDLVYAIYDLQRGFNVVGLVLECRLGECKVLWAGLSDTTNAPFNWYKRAALKVINESR